MYFLLRKILRNLVFVNGGVWRNGSRYTPPRKIPPGTFHLGIFSQGMFPPEETEYFFRFVAALFRFVARFARVRIEDSSGNRFTSTAYFTKLGYRRVKLDFEVKKNIYKPHQHRSLLRMVRISYSKSAKI